jgi:hypothetical protein
MEILASGTSAKALPSARTGSVGEVLKMKTRRMKTSFQESVGDSSRRISGSGTHIEEAGQQPYGHVPEESKALVAYRGRADRA